MTSRRKPTTYGKTSRRPDFTWNSNSGDFDQGTHATSWHDSGNPRPIGNNHQPFDKSDSQSNGVRKAGKDLPTHSKTSTHQFANGQDKHDPHLHRKRDPAEKLCSPKGEREESNEAFIFHNDLYSSMDPKKGPLPKRRKLSNSKPAEPAVSRNGRTVTGKYRSFDPNIERSSTRNILAAVSSTDRHHGLERSENRMYKLGIFPSSDSEDTKSYEALRSIKHDQPQRSIGDAKVRRSKPPWRTKKTSRTGEIASNLLHLEQGFPGSDVHESPNFSTTPRAEKVPDQDSSPPPSVQRTPPKVHTTKTRVTTPRQRHLWQMLLPDDVGSKKNDDEVGLLNLKISESNSSTNSNPNSSHGGSYSYHRNGIPKPRRRKKLINSLQQVNQEVEHRQEPQEHAKGLSDNDWDASIGSNLEGNLDQAQLATHSSNPMTHLGSSKVTYAHQRSYLTDDRSGDAPMPGVHSLHNREDSTENLHMPYEDGGFEAGLTKPQRDSPDDIDSSQGGTMRTIHELRKAGGNVRQLGDLEAIMDDIDGPNGLPPALRRSRMLELVSKLQEPYCARLFTEQSLEARLVTSKWLVDDPILRTLLAAALLSLTAAPMPAQTLFSTNDSRVLRVFNLLLAGKTSLDSLLQDPRVKLSKIARKEFDSFRHTLLRSNIWRLGRPPRVSEQFLGLQGLEYFIRFQREKGWRAEILSEELLVRIIKFLPTSWPHEVSQLADSEIHFAASLAVSILESCTVGDLGTSEDFWSDDTLEPVIKLLPNLSTCPETNIGPIRILALRLCLNLTNNSPRLCQAFSRADVVSAIFNSIHSLFSTLSNTPLENELTDHLDALILSLGLLINLVEWSDAMRGLLMNLPDGGSSYLEALLQIFQTRRAKTAEVRLKFYVRTRDTDLARCIRSKRPVSMFLLDTYQFSFVSCVLTKLPDDSFVADSKVKHFRVYLIPPRSFCNIIDRLTKRYGMVRLTWI
ncbi:MAG: hypothetical protein Q9190_002216 [Brigantiaea leucoxantha]